MDHHSIRRHELTITHGQSADKRGNGEDPLPLDAAPPDGQALSDPPARDRTPSTQAWTNEAHAWVFQRLRAEQRRVLELHLRENTQPEISQALGLPLSAVRKAIARIEELYRRCGER